MFLVLNSVLVTSYISLCVDESGPYTSFLSVCYCQSVAADSALYLLCTRPTHPQRVYHKRVTAKSCNYSSKDLSSIFFLLVCEVLKPLCVCIPVCMWRRWGRGHWCHYIQMQFDNCIFHRIDKNRNHCYICLFL